MEVKFPPAKRKGQIIDDVKSRFPIPIASETGVEATPGAWHYYKAVWKDNSVVVSKPEYAEALWNNVRKF